jgi:hypothetical protein
LGRVPLRGTGLYALLRTEPADVSAHTWELRAAMSMARLWRDQGKPQQARELRASGLRLVYGRLRHARSEGG